MGEAPVTVLLGLAVVWKLYQLSRAPGDRALRAVSLCLACRAAELCLLLPSVSAALSSLLGTGTGRLLAKIFAMDTAYWLVRFYLHLLPASRRSTLRVRRETLLLSLAVACVTTAFLATPPAARSSLFGYGDMSAPAVVAFHAVPPLYLMYTLAMALRWTWGYVRISDGAVATGLRLTAASLACMLAANVVFELSTLARWRGLPFPADLYHLCRELLTPAILVFATGLSYAGIVSRCASGRIWLLHRRNYRQLAPLWRGLHAAFPENTLRDSPAAPWRETLHAWGIHRRYYRRVIECRDGLVRLSPHLAACGVGTDASPETVAKHLPRALRAQASGDAAADRAVDLMQSVGDSLDADARQLIAVSVAFEKPRRLPPPAEGPAQAGPGLP
ncbi:MAB_1171c family putative transporter [Streptomyces sp. NPDC097595]|uniref:MAB_1171c family putative transporter n=1 Tax=Streptomyces sp. NPDC097595 TaxID=3366090 RepID=UPI0038141CF6